jgi:Protein of unknown function (DUF2723)
MAASTGSIQQDRCEIRPIVALGLALAVISIGFCLYYCTAAPGVGWADSAALQYRVWRLDLRGQLGLALAHPLYILLARGMTYLAWGDYAFRVTLFVVVCAAVTLGFAFDLLRKLSGSVLAATVGTISLAVSHTFWRNAAVAEKYDLYALSLAMELWLVEQFIRVGRPKWLLFALLVNGLNFSAHDLAIFHTPAYVVLIIWALRRGMLAARHACLGGLMFVIGSLPLLLLMISEVISGHSAFAVVKETFMGKSLADSVLAIRFPVFDKLIQSLTYFALNFPTPLALLAPLGVYRAWKNSATRWFVLFAGSIFLLDYVFSLRYMFPGGVFVFYTPDFVIFAMFIGLAVPSVRLPSRAKAVVLIPLALLPVLFYTFAPALVRSIGISTGIQRDIPFRDSLTFFLQPWKNNDDSAERYARAALTAAAPNGLLIADPTVKNALAYVRDVQNVEPGVALNVGIDVTALPPEIEITPETIRPLAQRGLVYETTIHPAFVRDWILEDYDLEPAGDPPGVVYRLKPRAP